MAKVRHVSRSRTIAAPAEVIFEVLADPARHHDIDGSDTVISVGSSAPERLSSGATFGMSMRMGVPYKIQNTVVEFVENELIAWRHFGGHRWRYELRSGTQSGTTEVTETFDWSTSKAPWALELVGYPKRNAASIDKTLNRLSALCSKRSE
jgi:uncharacterized protein YndB with AHSA1/START domain